jgi:hypothetical protein
MTPERLAEITSLAAAWRFNNCGWPAGLLDELTEEVFRLWGGGVPPEPPVPDSKGRVHIIDPRYVGSPTFCGRPREPDVSVFSDRVFPCHADKVDPDRFCITCTRLLREFRERIETERSPAQWVRPGLLPPDFTVSPPIES